jgi:uncharacterized membrane protein (DUF106 family)
VAEQSKGEGTQVDKHWHLRKEVNISHFLTTLVLAAGIVSWGMKMDQRLTGAEVRLEAMQEAVVVERAYQRQAAQDQRSMHLELVAEMRAMRVEFSELNRRLDRTQRSQDERN